MTASFGPQPGSYKVSGTLILVETIDGCTRTNASLSNSIALILRGGCTFFDKVINAQKQGALGVVIGDNLSEYPSYIPMGLPSGAPASAVLIPAVFIARADMVDLTFSIQAGIPLNATLDGTGEVESDSAAPVGSNLQTIGLLLMILPVVWCAIVGGYYIRRVCRDRRASRERASRTVNLPISTYQRSEGGSGALASTCTNESCAVCLEDFESGTRVKVLPCAHGFHPHCIDPWLADRSDLCPICKRSILEAAVPVGSNCCPFNVC